MFKEGYRLARAHREIYRWYIFVHEDFFFLLSCFCFKFCLLGFVVLFFFPSILFIFLLGSFGREDGNSFGWHWRGRERKGWWICLLVSRQVKRMNITNSRDNKLGVVFSEKEHMLGFLPVLFFLLRFLPLHLTSATYHDILGERVRRYTPLIICLGERLDEKNSSTSFTHHHPFSRMFPYPLPSPSLFSQKL